MDDVIFSFHSQTTRLYSLSEPLVVRYWQRPLLQDLACTQPGGGGGERGGTPMLHNLMYKRNDSIQNTYTKYDLSKWYHHVPYVLWWVLMEIHIIISYTVQYKIAHPFWAWRNWLVEWEGSGGSSSRRWTQPTSHQRWHFVHWYLHVQC